MYVTLSFLKLRRQDKKIGITVKKRSSPPENMKKMLEYGFRCVSLVLVLAWVGMIQRGRLRAAAS
jgi:hypothetical protein